MALSIKNDELESRIRRLATMSGETLTGALRLAVDNELSRRDADREAKFRTIKAKVAAIQDRVAALPRLGKFTDHDLYDEYGLPK